MVFASIGGLIGLALLVGGKIWAGLGILVVGLLMAVGAVS
jgi:hypothetical protein